MSSVMYPPRETGSGGIQASVTLLALVFGLILGLVSVLIVVLVTLIFALIVFGILIFATVVVLHDLHTPFEIGTTTVSLNP